MRSIVSSQKRLKKDDGQMRMARRKRADASVKRAWAVCVGAVIPKYRNDDYAVWGKCYPQPVHNITVKYRNSNTDI